MDFDTESGDVLLLKLSSQMSLDEGGLLISQPGSCIDELPGS